MERKTLDDRVHEDYENHHVKQRGTEETGLVKSEWQKLAGDYGPHPWSN